MLAVTTLNPNHHSHQTFATSPVLLGSNEKAGSNAVVVKDRLIAANQCEIHWSMQDDEFKVNIKNLGRSLALDIGPRIHAGVDVDVKLPTIFWVGDTTIQLTNPMIKPSHDQFLISKPISQVNAISVSALENSPAPATLASWFDALGQLQCSPVGSQEFFESAARLCFCPGGLDGAMVLLKKQDEWEVASSYICFPEHGFGYRKEIIQMAVDQRAVVYHDSQKMDSVQSNESGHSLVVCPIFDRKDDCIAVLYGFRSLNRRNYRKGIRSLEACFMELVAQSLSTAMTRLESDAEAAKARVLLEQAFSPRVARKLQQNPLILEGQNREVSVMFCDLRGFTGISERVGAKITHEFLTDVMDRFSEIITQHEGVVIDFYGDGLSAFWNAPIPVSNHAESACLCALEISKCTEEIEAKWRPRLLEEIRVGIGIHSGMAQVGNSGSRTRLKYGPRGNTVNLASRLEAATKSTGAGIIISADTLSMLPESLATRKICRAKLAGMSQPTELYQLLGSLSKSQYELTNKYEQALEKFETRQFYECLNLLSECLLECHTDRVGEFLFAQCQQLIGIESNVENRDSTKDQLFAIFDEPTSESQSGQEPDSDSSERKKLNANIPDE